MCPLEGDDGFSKGMSVKEGFKGDGVAFPDLARIPARPDRRLQEQLSRVSDCSVR
jgi:hypothetical protein